MPRGALESQPHRRQQKIYSGSTPGRLDFIKGVADYSRSLVLQIPIAAKTEVSVRTLDEPCLRFESADRDELAGCELPPSAWAIGSSTSEPERERQK